MTLLEKVEYYSFLHKQNLNGRETEDELFEAGILAGIEETENVSDEFAIGFAHFLAEHTYSCYENGWSNDFGHKELTTKELLEIYKKEKGL